MESRVFISYAHDDHSFVDKLTRDLRADGINPWVAINEITPGANWQKSIKEGLQNSSVVLFISSGRSAASQWVATEINLAMVQGKQVIPLILDDAGAQRLPHQFQNFKWIDFRPGYDDALKTLLDALQPLQKEKPVSTPKRKTKGYIFLSYAEEDSSFVDEMKGFLAKRGYAYWDYRESDRDYHQDLFLELEGVIQNAAAVLSFISPEWKLSRTAIKEYHFSTEVGVPIFLLKIRDPGPTLVIAGLPFINFTLDKAEGYLRLERALSRKGL